MVSISIAPIHAIETLGELNVGNLGALDGVHHEAHGLHTR
jgi:hypothetical protein